MHPTLRLTMRSRDTLPPAIADSDYLSAKDAARILSVKPQTLYTYVSRGLIRSVAQLDRKQRLYYREDVEKVRATGRAPWPSRRCAGAGSR